MGKRYAMDGYTEGAAPSLNSVIGTSPSGSNTGGGYPLERRSTAVLTPAILRTTRIAPARSLQPAFASLGASMRRALAVARDAARIKSYGAFI